MRVDRPTRRGLVDPLVVRLDRGLWVDRLPGRVVRRGRAIAVGRRPAPGEAPPAGLGLERRRLLGVQIRRDAVGLRLQAQLGLGGLVRIGGPRVVLDGLGHRVVTGGGAGAAVTAQRRSLPAVATGVAAPPRERMYKNAAAAMTARTMRTTTISMPEVYPATRKRNLRDERSVLRRRWEET